MTWADKFAWDPSLEETGWSGVGAADPSARPPCVFCTVQKV